MVSSQPAPAASAPGAEKSTVPTEDELAAFAEQLRRLGPKEGARDLNRHGPATAAQLLQRCPAPLALDIIDQLDESRRLSIHDELSADTRAQWKVNAGYGKNQLGRLMELPAAVHRFDTTVAQAIAHLREEVKKRFVTYLYVTDDAGHLLGLVVMREMLLSKPEDRLGDIMLKDPFTFDADTSVEDAMRVAASKQFPVYPVCNDEGQLAGLVRGADLFEQNMASVIVQAGAMVGVEKEERVTTTWRRSLKMRHPWLQLNLLTAVMAGAVVGMFEETINQVVVLAAFLPVLAGQSGNTGCQALAVTLRGMTLGDLAQRKTLAIVTKEALVGALNGAIIGVIAAVLMFFYARSSSPDTNAYMLSFVVWMAMTGSCIASGVTGTLVPIALKKMGADPATASSIFLTTATDVISMGLLLGLASTLIIG